MHTNSRTEVQSAPRRGTFTEGARRAQLIDCAIDVLRTHGYAGASVGRVAERAEVSKGVVTYHFPSRAELLEATVEDVFARGIAFANEGWFDAARTPRDQLRAYLESNLAFIAAHPAEIAAVVEVTRNHRDADGVPVFGSQWEQTLIEPLEEIFREGQLDGEFRPFVPRVMAVSLRRVIDGFSFQVIAVPGLDVAEYVAEVVALFDHATRAEEQR